MNFGTNLFIIVMLYILIDVFKIIFMKKERSARANKNIQLDDLRKSNLTELENQKAFLDLKYPKKEPFKWSIINVSKVVFKIICFVALIIFVKYLWTTYIGFEFKFYQAIALLIIIPILLNWILKKFNLQGDDISVYLR